MSRAGAHSTRWAAVYRTGALLGLDVGVLPRTPTLGIGTLGLLLLLAGCSGGPSDIAPSPAPTTERVVDATEVRTLPFPHLLPVAGTVVARQRIEIASRITGFLQQVSVQEGDRVEPGTLLAVIDDTGVEAAVVTAEAAVASAQADLDEAKGDVARYRKLARTQTLTEDDLRKAEVRLVRAEAERVRTASDLTTRRQDRRYARLVSPARAQVRERLRDPGDLVTLGDPILRLEALEPLDLELFVPLAQALALAEGQSIRLELDGPPGSLTAPIAAVIHSADSATRLCKVRLALPEQSGLIPGRFGRALLVLGEDLIPALPTSALTERAGVPGVFVIDASGRARFRSLQVGRLWQGAWEVLAGIEAGATVVNNPASVLRDGDRVQVRTPADGS